MLPIPSGQLRESERVCDEIIKLSNGDPHFGTQVSGYSPLLAAESYRLWCIGFMRDPESFFQRAEFLRQRALDVSGNFSAFFRYG